MATMCGGRPGPNIALRVFQLLPFDSLRRAHEGLRPKRSKLEPQFEVEFGQIKGNRLKGTGCVGASRRKVANERVAQGKT
jgi:hypothetical protein